MPTDGKISAQPFRRGTTGTPILIDVPGAIECRVSTIVEQGDHHIVLGEVVDAHLNKPPTGRPGAAILEMKDLGDNVFDTSQLEGDPGGGSSIARVFDQMLIGVATRKYARSTAGRRSGRLGQTRHDEALGIAAVCSAEHGEAKGMAGR